jgi:hypothetical protein
MTKEQKIVRAKVDALGIGQTARQSQPGLQYDGRQPRRLLPLQGTYDKGGELALQVLAAQTRPEEHSTAMNGISTIKNHSLVLKDMPLSADISRWLQAV